MTYLWLNAFEFTFSVWAVGIDNSSWTRKPIGRCQLTKVLGNVCQCEVHRITDDQNIFNELKQQSYSVLWVFSCECTRIHNKRQYVLQCEATTATSWRRGASRGKYGPRQVKSNRINLFLLRTVTFKAIVILLLLNQLSVEISEGLTITIKILGVHFSLKRAIYLFKFNKLRKQKIWSRNLLIRIFKPIAVRSNTHFCFPTGYRP